MSALFRDIDRDSNESDPELLDLRVVESDIGTVDSDSIEEPPLEDDTFVESLCTDPDSATTVGEQSIELGNIERGDVQTLSFVFELCAIPAALRMNCALKDTSSVAALQAIRVATWVGRADDDLDSLGVVFQGSLHDMIGTEAGIRLRTGRPPTGGSSQGCFRPGQTYRAVFAWWLPESAEFDPDPSGIAFDLDLSAMPCGGQDESTQ